jgi:hypothetical protein
LQARAAADEKPFSCYEVVGGVDGTRTRGLRRDRQEAMTALRSRPRKVGVGCPPSWQFDTGRGRVFRNGLQILASTRVLAPIPPHDHFWRDFEDILARGDKSGRQALEQKCDGIAVLTLIVLEFDPAALTDALPKFSNFNAAIGATANVDEYPALPQRHRFIKGTSPALRCVAATDPSR